MHLIPITTIRCVFGSWERASARQSLAPPLSYRRPPQLVQPGCYRLEFCWRREAAASPHTSCLPLKSISTATDVRKRPRDNHSMGLNPTTRALKDLEQLGLRRSVPISPKDRRRDYGLGSSGVRSAHETGMPQSVLSFALTSF